MFLLFAELIILFSVVKPTHVRILGVTAAGLHVKRENYYYCAGDKKPGKFFFLLFFSTH